MLNPQFPYKGKQIIITSDRVLVHSKDDAVFLFGKKMVGISSTQTINLDAREKILIDCDKIELGHRAELFGDPLILGNKFKRRLSILIQAIQYAASQMQTVNATNTAQSLNNIQIGGNTLYNACKDLLDILNNDKHPDYPLSKNTFTK